jgi:hypothetical protein
VNGGLAWGLMSSGTSQTLNSVHFADRFHGWVVGNAGVILKYVPGVWNVGIQSQEKKQKVEIYPNPTSDKLNLQSIEQDMFVTITNSIGQMVYQGQLNGYQLQVDVSRFTAGIYTIEFKGIENQVTDKFIKQ